MLASLVPPARLLYHYCNTTVVLLSPGQLSAPARAACTGFCNCSGASKGTACWVCGRGGGGGQTSCTIDRPAGSTSPACCHGMTPNNCRACHPVRHFSGCLNIVLSWISTCCTSTGNSISGSRCPKSSCSNVGQIQPAPVVGRL